ncbi:uncharacterized protein [Littorina saxatilis]|uniref:uncharacterized protein n=1 Tax=Littorina saxatilis TaxID=31220 RepID=UPI0038B493EB
MEKEFFPKVDQEQPTEQNSLDGSNVTIIKYHDGGRHASDVDIPDIGTESFQPTASELHSVADMNFDDSDSGRSHAVRNEDKESDGREVSREEEVVPKAWDQKQDSAGAGDINKSSEETMPGDEEYGDIYEECGDIYEEHSDISSEDEWKPEKKKADSSLFQRKSDSTSEEESSDISIERSRPRQKQTGDTLQRKSEEFHKSALETPDTIGRNRDSDESIRDKGHRVGKHLMLEIAIQNGKRAGIFNDMTRREVEGAVKQDDDYVMMISEGKTFRVAEIEEKDKEESQEQK